MCRAEAQRVYSRKPDLDQAGVSLVGIVKEDLPGEIDAFREGYWPDAPLYMNSGLEFYRALHGEKEKKTSMASFLAKIANPWSTVNKNLKKAGDTKGNMVGEGFIHGGVMVVKKGTKEGDPAIFSHSEAEIGDAPSTDVLIEAAKKAAA